MEAIKGKKYVIGCDAAAVDLKMEIIKLLEEEGLEYEDVGVSTGENTIYPQVAKLVADKIIASDYQKEGILICGTGIGMAITANKFPGIYAAQCYDTYAAERARLSNNTNVITLGARITGPVLARRIVQTWLSLEFTTPCRSTSKVEQIKEYEKENFKNG